MLILINIGPYFASLLRVARSISFLLLIVGILGLLLLGGQMESLRAPKPESLRAQVIETQSRSPASDEDLVIEPVNL